MRPMTVGEIAKAVGSTDPAQLASTLPITSITTDSRPMNEDGDRDSCLFVALRGENFDGHRFVPVALNTKAAFALVDQGDPADPRLIFCKDTEQGFLDLAGYYRNKFHPKIVGITGSVGKTTTKEMIAQVLSAQFKTLKTQGNLNNRVGLPKTLLNLDETYEAAVIEMGMNSFGEISDMTRRARPDIGVITNIGISHVEFLGSREGILKAKLEMLEGMQPGSPLILCGDNDLLRQVHDDRFPITTYGILNTSCDVRGTQIRACQGKTSFHIQWQGKDFAAVIPTFGEHNVLNALAAFAVGIHCGMEPHAIVEALATYKPAGMRQKVVRHNDIQVVEDCYNAGPDSMIAAIKAFGEMPPLEGGRKILVMADMLELGDFSKECHRQVGQEAAAHGLDVILCYGPESQATAEAAREADQHCDVRHFTDKESLIRALLLCVRKGDTIWFKGSRGMKLEEVISRLYEKF